MALRRSLWDNLIKRKDGRGREEWCFSGDFNEVLCGGERLGEGGGVNRRGMEDFRAFFENMSLVDVPCVEDFKAFFENMFLKTCLSALTMLGLSTKPLKSSLNLNGKRCVLLVEVILCCMRNLKD